MKRRVPAVIFWSVAIATAISLGFSAGPVFWRVTGDTGQSTVASATDKAAQDMSRLDLGPIIDFAPFGSIVTAEETPSVAGETSLGLTLLGVTIGNPVSASRAIIRGADREIQSYGIGANVTATAQLAEVNKGFVVLKVENRLETLSFASREAAATAPRSGPDLCNMIPRSTNAAPAPATSNAPDAVIARYRAAIHQDAQGVMNRLGLEQSERGYRISANASSGVRQAGFRPGDVVTVVNGQQVGDIDTDRRFFDEVAASGRARVELERDGQTIIMTFPLQ